MSTGGQQQHTPANRLWLARKRRGLGQKQVAYLLNQHTADQVSRYEHGVRLPTLEVALVLEMIYGTPVRVLFADLHDQLQAELSDRLRNVPQLKEFALRHLTPDGQVREYCAYADLLAESHPAPVDQVKVRRHVTELAKKLAYL